MGTTRGSNARSDTRSTASASQLGDQRGEEKSWRIEARRSEATNAREKRIDERYDGGASGGRGEATEERGGRSPSTSDPGRRNGGTRSSTL